MIFKKIRKGHVDWRNFLCGTPANDYIFQKDTYEYRIDRAVEIYKKCRLHTDWSGSWCINSCRNKYGW